MKMISKINKNLWRGSFLLIAAFGLFSFLHFLFQLFMARYLTIAEYGVLSALFAIIYITLIFTESIQTIITRYAANEESDGKLKNIFIKFIKKCSKISFLVFIFYLIASIPLSYVLKIDYLLLAFVGLVIFNSTFVPISRGIMQGKKRFKALALNLVTEASFKLVLGVLFVFIGWKVYGAILGVILGGIIAFLFSFIQLNKIIKSNNIESKFHGIHDYARPAFIIIFVVIIFYSIDVILAKIFFSPDEAGFYALASILGKIIFWGTLPISKAMFPESASKNKSEAELKNIFNNALFILAFGIISALLIFYFFPNFVIKIFSGKIVPETSKILFIVGIAFSFISLANLFLLYKLSINKIKNYNWLFIFIVVEIVIFSLFSKNLMQFSVAFVAASAAFLWGTIKIVGRD